MASSPSPFPHASSAKKGATFASAVPTQIVSNEEFTPFSQTADQARVESRVVTIVERAAARRGLTRRDFLRTTGGMAAALLAMNSIFGKFFEVGEIELFETAAFAEQQGAPYFIFDVQTHYVGSHFVRPMRNIRERARCPNRGCCRSDDGYGSPGSIRSWREIEAPSTIFRGKIL